MAYLAAFASLGLQVAGLVGVHGLLPAGEFLERARTAYGWNAYRLWPTLGWLAAGDTALRGYAGAGVTLAALLIVGIAPLPTLALLWVLYLSLAVVGQTFLSFQWDALLLETGLMAMFYAPAVWRERLSALAEPFTSGRWLVWWLLFRLMVLSGLTKLASGDPSWRRLTALTYHYETQPLPTWIGWYAAQLPSWFHHASVIVMFGVEIGVPLLVFLPGRWRLRPLACAGLVAFQVAIALTGNYGFFNLLAIVLCLSLLDDGALLRLAPARMRAWLHRIPARREGTPLDGPVRLGATALLVVLGALACWREIRYTLPGASAKPLSWLDAPVDAIAPFRSINGYGLFRVMTTRRREIVVEASADGRTWHEYQFRWKPGALTRAPAFVAPHQPRLDWQMWFAALDPRSAEHWLVPLIERLLRGDPAVTALIGPQSWTQTPPVYVRLALYQYHFSPWETRRRTGEWWQREFVGYLTPAVSLADLTPRE